MKGKLWQSGLKVLVQYRYPGQSRYQGVARGAGHNTHGLDAEMVGNTKCGQKIGIETIDAAVLATPLRGKSE